MRWLKLAFLFLSVPLFGQQLGFALEQIGGQAIIDAGLTGKGVKIGIIDGGFLRANNNESLRHIFENNQIAEYKDYLNPDAEDFAGSAAFDDVHGTEVWELIGGLNADRRVQYGLATGATYYLARTDHGGYERREEEQFAIEAMEWMAKEGVQIINISLGYNFGFSDKRENYQPKQIDGKSTLLTQAINHLSEEYDILFVVAAGNDGDNKWKILGSPGDAENALTVGATKLKVWDGMKYSSKGPEWLDYVKPEISCFSSLGTSFSAPIITGLAACLLERDSSATAHQLKSAIINSGNLIQPNNFIGHGVPNAELALEYLKGAEILWDKKRSAEKNYVLELKKPSIYITVYHKKGWRVVKKEVIRTDKTKIKIKRKEDADTSTIISEEGSLEVIWEY
ncbi:S8 family serine peptidase [Ekhidna sp. To15]|uniref:S8 family serine peptidase n=1 Tax=Ekhidna sp. To15 TaxID=3395267 RepID=UPI003F521200